MTSLTRALVERLAVLRREAVDPDTAEAARRLLLDHLGVAAAGAQTDSACAVRAALADLGPGEGASLPLVGTAQRAPALEAAFATGASAHAIEFDDVHHASSSHPGAVVFPAAFAAAALSSAEGEALLRAAVAGYEVMGRVGRALDPAGCYRRGFHPTAVAGHLGAAAAAADLFALDADATTSALGIAATFAGGSMAFLTDGASTKRLHPGQAARAGVWAALLARRGHDGPADGLAGPHGLLASFSEAPAPDRLLEDWGARPPEIRATGMKPHACCRYEQACLDALLALRRDGLRAEDVASVRLGLLSAGMDIVARPPARKRRPTSVVDAQFSLPFGAAVILREGVAGPDQHHATRFDDPAVQALMDRVACETDAALDAAYPERWMGWARVTTCEGRTYEAHVDAPHGDPANPLSDAELRAKFDALALPVYGAEGAAALADAVTRVDEPGGPKRLFERLSTSASR